MMSILKLAEELRLTQSKDASKARACAGAAQCGLQSPVEADLGGLASVSAHATLPVSASNEPIAIGAYSVVPFHLGCTGHRLSQSSAAAAPTTTAEVFHKHPTARLASGYSWRTPFLRRPSPFLQQSCVQKNETHPGRHRPFTPLTTNGIIPLYKKNECMKVLIRFVHARGNAVCSSRKHHIYVNGYA
jgi:hypothetical protein